MRGNYYFARVMIKLETGGNKGEEMANIPGIIARALIIAAGDWPNNFIYFSPVVVELQDCAQIESSENEGSTKVAACWRLHHLQTNMPIQNT